MAISRKPKPADITSPTVDVDALINKGGSVARPSVEQGPVTSAKPEAVVLRMPADVLSKVDRLVSARRVKTPRHTWLMEAVIEKLEREEQIPQ